MEKYDCLVTKVNRSQSLRCIDLDNVYYLLDYIYCVMLKILDLQISIVLYKFVIINYWH